MTAQRQQRSGEALADLGVALWLSPRFSSAYYSRGYILKREGDFEQAIADLSTFLRFRPRDVAALRERAEAYEAINDLPHAIEDYRLVCRSEGADSRSCNNFAWYLVMGPRELRNPAEALAPAERAFRLSPSAEYRNTLAVVQYRLKNYQRAMELLQENVKGQHETVIMDYYVLAMTSHRLQQATKARDWLGKAIAITPGSEIGASTLKDIEALRTEATALINGK